MANDLTKGKPTKLILAFTLPILIGYMFQQLYAMADTIVVGQFIGVEALAAVGASGGITFFVLGFMMGLANGFAVIVSQRFGAEDYDQMRHAIGMTILFSLAMGIVVTILAVSGTRSILELMNTPSNIIDNSEKYLKVIFAGTLATIAYNTISAILRALGDSKTPLIFLIISSVINVVGDIGLIVIFKMGVEGTAYATITAQGISFLLCLIYTYKKYPMLHLSKKDFIFDFHLVGNLLKIGIPGALSSSITALGIMILQTSINLLGSDTVAAYTAGTKVEQFFTMPMLSLGMAMATYAGQNLGAGKISRIKEGLHSATIITLLYSVIGGSILFFFGDIFTELFVSADQTHVIQISQTYLSIVAVMCWALGFVFVYRSVIQGMGNGVIPMISGGMELAMRVVAALFLSKWFGFVGICIASPIAWVAADLLCIPYSRMMMNRLNKRIVE